MNPVFSHSRLDCFERCPRQFRYRYVDRLPAPAQSIEAFLGKRVHDILERLHRFVAKGRVPSLAAVLHRFAALWDERFEPDRIRINRAGVHPEDYRALGEHCLRNFYRHHYPFDGDRTIAVEERVQFSLDEGGRYQVQGIIDRLVRARDGRLEIHDYKTGRRLPSQRQLDADRQLALYEMGVRNRYPEADEIRLVWHYLQHGQVRSSTRTQSQLCALGERTMELIDRIHGESEYAPRPGPLCGWCEYRDLCPARATQPEPVAEAAPVQPPTRAREPGLPMPEPRGQLLLL